MIKFSRKIRQYLLMENKTGKYFKYAIGEIILVVIGILIALQINNWNEHKKERAQEKELLEQLQSEFQSNLEQLDQKIEIRKKMVASCLKLLYYVDNPEKRQADSILSNLGYTFLAPTFDPIVNDINSSGRIQLLKNPELKEKLSRWTSEIIQVTEEEQVWLTYRNNHYTPIILKHHVFRKMVNKYWENNIIENFHLDDGTKTQFFLGKSKSATSLDDLIDDPQFETHMAQCASFAKLTNSQSFSLRNRITGLLDLINNELDKLDD
ncbi:DUF6090 family protein [Ichthyenterobacterium sp. W332]|uniref:DUF6090 family protein n=1 Tax=Microcosmobacter mediterraneus TaxID=3075607 RepID=A0ABU2YJ40_9FLAO|nr:DUF6090 family protein [Ichthyenterobacterium sp. W332]MDT0558188.1 DUF6090 family protein [Ichthyenterobacterium sp. W332]